MRRLTGFASNSERQSIPSNLKKGHSTGLLPKHPTEKAADATSIVATDRKRGSVLFAAVHMSAYGTKRTCRDVCHLSAFGGKADIQRLKSTSTSWGVPLIFSMKAMAASRWLRLIGSSRPTWTAPAGCVHQWARVAHGRTRMIVFPLRRSVGFKAATASSRVETLPMFVR